MDSLLGFSEAPINDVVIGQSHSFKLVPWISWDEWDFVRASLFSNSSQSVASALQRIAAWRSRGCLPVAVDVTASIIEIQQRDPFFRDDIAEKAVESEEMMAMLYCMAIMRLVNGVIEKTRQKREVSIAEAAGAIGIPRILIDIRHESSHRDLPSLKLVRMASTKALDWLKSYYWEPQKNSIPNPGEITSNLRKEIRHKLLELAFCLKAKQARRSGSKKQQTKALKNVVRLCSSSSTEAVAVLLKLLVKSLGSPETIELLKNSENMDNGDTIPPLLEEWKPLILKLSSKEPDLLWSLMKAVIEKIMDQESKKDERLLSPQIPETDQTELSFLFQWFVGILNSKKLAPEAKGSLSETVCNAAHKNFPKASVFELLRKCLLTSHGNKYLMNSAIVLARLLGNKTLNLKLEKLLSLNLMDVDVTKTLSSKGNLENFSQEKESIHLAAKSLEVIKLHRAKSSNKEPTSNQEDKKTRWALAKSWSSCPIGLLPHSLGNSGTLPILDCNSESPEIPNSSNSKDLQELNQHSRKREAHCAIEPLGKLNPKKVRETIEACEDNEEENTCSENAKGHLIIDGIWKKVSKEELIAIASAIRILV